MNASITEDVPALGVSLTATLIPITRGFAATVTYNVDVYTLAGGHRALIENGAAMLPPDMVAGIKRRLWEQLEPNEERQGNGGN